MLTQHITCGYCDETLLLDEHQHYCDERAEFEDEELFAASVVGTFFYSATAEAEARQFLTDHPEFREFQNVRAYRKVGQYDTADQHEYTTPVNYATETGLPVDTNFIGEVTRDDEWDGIYANRDQYQREQLTYWKDVEPKRCTFAIYWWTNRPGSYGYPLPYLTEHLPPKFTMSETYTQRYASLDYEAKNRYGVTLRDRLEFEELQGFASDLLIDANITEKFQYKVYNVYYGRDQYLHCGLLTFTPQGVTCSHSGCYWKTHVLPYPTDPTREQMEDYVRCIIRHGNNHGPDWYVKRSDFTFIHASNCDTLHSRDEFCNANVPLVNTTTETLTGALNFLIRHRKFCRDSRCRCTAYYHTLSHYEREKIAA